MLYFLLFAYSLLVIEPSINIEKDQTIISINNGKALKEQLKNLQFIEGGEFTLGKTSFFDVTDKDSSLFSNTVARRAKVNSFYLSTTEVTNSEWREFYLDKAKELGVKKAKLQYYPDTAVWITDFPYSYNEPMAKNYFNKEQFKDYPVVGISWHQANEYCKWKSDKINQILVKSNINSLIEFRLPTENEWECAAIMNTKSKKYSAVSTYGWDEKNMLVQLNSLTNIGQVLDANKVPIKKYGDDGFLYTAPVASFPPNDKGIFDMAGNVSEWTSDTAYVYSMFQNSKIDRLTTSEAVENEIQNAIAGIENNSLSKFDSIYQIEIIAKLRHDKRILSNGNVMICKGGSWESSLVYSQNGVKQGFNQKCKSSTLGFRVAMSDIPKELEKFIPAKKRKSFR
jgi:formylglycine-generating enzyme required for sulfatase activity